MQEIILGTLSAIMFISLFVGSILAVPWFFAALGSSINGAEKWYCERKGGERIWVERRNIENSYRQTCAEPNMI